MASDFSVAQQFSQNNWLLVTDQTPQNFLLLKMAIFSDAIW
jgi:hypothetical protein